MGPQADTIRHHTLDVQSYFSPDHIAAPPTRPRGRLVTCGFIFSCRASPVHSLTHATLAAITPVETPRSHARGEMPPNGTAQAHLLGTDCREGMFVIKKEN